MISPTVHRISIPVTDQVRATDFYQHAFGYERIVDVPVPMGESARWIELGSPAGGPTLVLVTWLDRLTPGSLEGVMLQTEDVQRTCEHVRGSGYRVHGPVDTPWGRQATIKDPDGNTLVLTEPPAVAE